MAIKLLNNSHKMWKTCNQKCKSGLDAYFLRYKSQDFVQSQEKFAKLHNYETVTFKNSAYKYIPNKQG